MSLPAYLISDQLCTYLKKGAHWRGEKYIAPKYCEEQPIVQLTHALTGDVYFMCKTHWTDRSMHVAQDMGLSIESVSAQG